MTISFLGGVHAANLHYACKNALGTGIEISTKAFGGPDLVAVFTLNPNGRLRGLPMEKRKLERVIQRTGPPVLGLRGQMTVAIENARLTEKFPIFKETDPGGCASAGTRKFI
jgi:hypothetical protein